AVSTAHQYGLVDRLVLTSAPIHGCQPSPRNALRESNLEPMVVMCVDGGPQRTRAASGYARVGAACTLAASPACWFANAGSPPKRRSSATRSTELCSQLAAIGSHMLRSPRSTSGASVQPVPPTSTIVS